MSENEGDRYSRVVEPYIIKDEDDRAYAEAKNALVQFDQTVSFAEERDGSGNLHSGDKWNICLRSA